MVAEGGDPSPFVETDPTVPVHVKAITTGDVAKIDETYDAAFDGTGTLTPKDVRLSRSEVEARGDSAVTENNMFDAVAYFSGSVLYSYTNMHPVVAGLRLETAPITNHVYGGFPVVPGTNNVVYVSDPVYSFLPHGLYSGKFWAHIVEFDGVTPYGGEMPVTFTLAAIPTNTIVSYTNYVVVPVGVSAVKLANGDMRRINLSGSLESDIRTSDYGSDFYFGGLMTVVNPTTNTYMMMFNTGGDDYKATVSIPIPTGDLPTKEWIEDRDAPKTGAAYSRTYDTATSTYGWQDAALAVNYASTEFLVSNAVSETFEIDIGTSGAYLSMVTMYLNCTNTHNIVYNDVRVSLYIHPSRLGEFAQYRAEMVFASQALTNTAPAGTNIVYVADTSGFEVDSLVVLDPANVFNNMSQNRVAEVVDLYTLRLENMLSTTNAVGTLISRGNQFGQLMYYDVAQSNKLWGAVVFTNSVTTKFNVSAVLVK